MTEQPEALRLADALESDFDPDWMYELGYDQIAAELRRLHEEVETCGAIIQYHEASIKRMGTINQELREALDNITRYAERQVAAFNTGVPYLDMTLFPRLCDAARAAIAKAEGETK